MGQMDKIPQLEIETRIAKLQKILVRQQLDGALLLWNSDIFYFTGTKQNSYLFVPQSGDPVLMVKRGLDRGIAESFVKDIVSIKSPKEIPSIIATHGITNLTKIGTELDVMPVNLYNFYGKIFDQIEFSDISPAIKQIRAVKSAYEVNIIRQALKIMDEAFFLVPSLLREGMTEIELAALFEAELRKRGYAGVCKMRAFNQSFFYGNVCSGKSGISPSFFDGPVGGTGVSLSDPQGAGWKIINKNEPIYIDYTCIYQGYTGDQTRMFCMGDLPEKLKKAYNDAVFIKNEAVKSMHPGVLAEEPHILALKLAEELGYKDNFMGYKNNQVKFLGHGLGLELDELPIVAKGIKTKIVTGMTFALEPKFVFPEGAIGIENSFVMTENGPECLSITAEDIIYIK